jgi:hypothetical protein
LGWEGYWRWKRYAPYYKCRAKQCTQPILNIHKGTAQYTILGQSSHGVDIITFAHVNNVRGKIFDKQTKIQAWLLHPLSQPQFELGECNNNTIGHLSFLERSKHKVGNIGKKQKIVTSN